VLSLLIVIRPHLAEVGQLTLSRTIARSSLIKVAPSEEWRCPAGGLTALTEGRKARTRLPPASTPRFLFTHQKVAKASPSTPRPGSPGARSAFATISSTGRRSAIALDLRS